MTAKIAPTLRQTFALNSGDEDVYGWCMEWSFAVSAVLYATEGHIPWQYRNGQPAREVLAGLALARKHLLADNPDYTHECPECRNVDWATFELYDLCCQLETTHDELRQAGAVLNRYRRFIVRAGKDY